MQGIFKFEDNTRSVISIPENLMLSDGTAIKYAYDKMRGHWPKETQLLSFEIKFEIAEIG